MAATPSTAATDSFPTFLDADPYPSNSRHGRPVSSGSATTNAMSENEGGDSGTGKEIVNRVPGITGRVGEPGLPPSRPVSGAPSVSSLQKPPPRSSHGPPSSRKGLAALAARGVGTSKRNAENDGDDSSRPDSSLSRTHVPSLTAQGFFRPMSSQKLQAQRGQRPSSSLAQHAETRPSSDSVRPTRHRNSNASVNTLRDARPTTRDGDAPPLPASRGTMSTHDGTAYPDGQFTGSVNSNSSGVPLQASRTFRPANLESHSFRSDVPPNPPPKSPKSLRASLGLNSRRTSKQDQDRRPLPGQHTKLESNPTSPKNEKAPLPVGTSASKTSGGRNYEYFAGNLLFFVEGRCLNTKARPLNVLTFIITALPALLFFGFSAPFLWHHVSPAIPIIFAYIFYITISAFLHAAFSDPGILPRNLHPHPPNPEEENDPLVVGPPTTEWIMVKTFPSRRMKATLDPNTAEAQRGAATAMEVPTKYCKSCNIWRPPRAHHCRICDACIETQDHHCVWLNNCVGRRNYRYFFTYVGFGSIMALLLLAFSITHVSTYARQHHLSFGAALSGRTQERVAFALFLYSVVALPYPGSLFMYHTFLVSRGETTREYLNSHKFLPKDRHRPFSQSTWWENMMVVLARPRPPSYMEFKGRYREGDLRYGNTQSKKERKAELKGRYSTQHNGNAANGRQKTLVEMKPMSPPQGKPQAKGSGFVHTPLNNTPR